MIGISGTHCVSVQQLICNKTEIAEARNAVLVYKNISRLDIAMDHPAGV